MKNLALVKRYTQGLVNSLADQEDFDSVLRHLRDFFSLMEQEKKLNYLLGSPVLSMVKRLELTQDILDRAMESLLDDSGSKADSAHKSARFILLLVENERLDLLGEIIHFLPLHWNEDQGISTFDVLSVIPLTGTQKTRLEKRLSELEKRPVNLNYRNDPDLIGGIVLQKGNTLYDISVEGNLNRLKEKIVEG